VIGRKVFFAINLVAGMSGLRLDRGRMLLAWIPVLGLIGLGAHLSQVYEFQWAWMAGSWIAYYGGNTLILGSGIRRWMITRLGPERAYSIYEMICGWLFFTIGSGFTVSATMMVDGLVLDRKLAWSLGILLAIFGFGIKVWATALTGLDTYYYRDLFLHEHHENWVARGPYRYLSSPMYGAGNMHGYSAALFVGSIPGLLFALCCHLGIYGFYFLVERPFIRRTYTTELGQE